MRISWILSFLAAIVVCLVGVVLWTVLPTGLTGWEQGLLLAIDLLCIVWSVVLIALALAAVSRWLSFRGQEPPVAGPWE